MKPVFLFGLLFVATLAVALWFFGVFDAKGPPRPPEPVVPPSTNGGPPGTLAPTSPKDEPPPEVPPFTSPVRVLVVGGAVRSFSEWLYMMWMHVPEISWQAWYSTPPAPGNTTHSTNLPAIEAVPGPEALDSVHVLVVAELDPKELPVSFWERAAERVRAGAMGLLVFPSHRFGKALAEVPALADLMPVDAGAVVGTQPTGAVAGVLPESSPFRLTDVGVRHPASRLSEHPDWSRRIWDGRATAKGRWATKFVHPIDKAREGTATLVEVAPPNSPALPALVASDPTKGRVLWAGGFLDVDDPAYRETKSFDLMRALVLHWVVWLATPS